MVVIIGIGNADSSKRRLFSLTEDGNSIEKEVSLINAYLAEGANIIVTKRKSPMSKIFPMDYGNKPTDGGHLLLNSLDITGLGLEQNDLKKFVKPLIGSAEFIRGLQRYCLWIDDSFAEKANSFIAIKQRVNAVRDMRQKSSKVATQKGALYPHRFDEVRQKGKETAIIVPRVSSETRNIYLAVLPTGTIVLDSAFALYAAPLWFLQLSPHASI